MVRLLQLVRNLHALLCIHPQTSMPLIAMNSNACSGYNAVVVGPIIMAGPIRFVGYAQGVTDKHSPPVVTVQTYMEVDNLIKFVQTASKHESPSIERVWTGYESASAGRIVNAMPRLQFIPTRKTAR